MSLLSKASALLLAAVAAGTLSTAAFAFDGELSQLEAAVKSELTSMDISTDHLMNATLSQLAEIKGVLDGDADDMKGRIDVILGNDHPHVSQMTFLAPGADGKSQLEQGVVADLQSVGITVNDPGSLTISQLAELKAVFDGHMGGESGATKERAQAIIDG